jgi:hypothetical protein|tara:strand:+ start:3302 stop:3811 length:510 start_codon:yes stop_codon:yes gene_type:complete
MSVVGTAKIASVVGSGVYTITQQFFDTASGTYKDGTVGLVGATASDLNLSEGWSVGDKVAFQMQESWDGKTQAVIIGTVGVVFADEIWVEAVQTDVTTINHLNPEDPDGGTNTFAPIDTNGDATLCSPIVVCDDKGHIVGWYGLSGGVYAAWYSPWGYDAPALPLDGTQ